MITKRDAVIISAILLLSIGGVLLPQLLSSGGSAVISIDGKTVRTVSLDKDLTFNEGGISFEVKNGGIAVISSPCRDKICQHTGYISSPCADDSMCPRKNDRYHNGKFR